MLISILQQAVALAEELEGPAAAEATDNSQRKK